MPRRCSPLAATSLALLLVACAPGAAPDAAAGGAEAAVQRFYDQELSWGPCAPFASTPGDTEPFADPALQCARLAVPLDHADPDGEEASIAVMRKPAEDPASRIGSLVTNPGGPGASGLNRLATATVPEAAGTEIGRRFDLVSFDPRGVGASEPALDCLTDPEREEERADLPEISVEILEAESRELVDKCVERVGPEVLATVGTRDVVRDLDVLRSALDDEKLSFLGYSYGTLIGARYAAAYPDRVRALVLDGAVDPARDPVEQAVNQAAGFQGAFEAFAADCATEPTCPLGTDPAQATQRYTALMQPLLEQPADVGDGRVLGFGDALTGVQQALYVEDLWDVLQVGLTEVQQGRGRVLMLLADLYEERAPDGSYSDLLEAFIAVRCVDQRPLTDLAEIAELERRAAEAAPFRDDGRGPVPARDPCAFWPVPPTSEPVFPTVEGLPATLVVSTTGDPATPYEAGVVLADRLGAALLTVDGDQHLAVLRGNACADQVATRYLVDLVVPDEGTRC